YTQAGTLYAVDARLRPGGREGELVQTPAGLRQYFAGRAGAWEAMSYLKARTVAGEDALGAAALEGIHESLRRHFAGRAFGLELRALRERIERDGRRGHWGLKTAAGGYYDADFLLSQRLLVEGRTPPPAPGLSGWARALGHEELADLVTYLRAADHALRVATGKAGSAIPAAGAAVARAWSWLERIRPALPDVACTAATVPERLEAARARVRILYQALL
ncbi:MAG: hypothetical protein ACRD1Y_10955, partial [Terriglobales bacterium]